MTKTVHISSYQTFHQTALSNAASIPVEESTSKILDLFAKPAATFGSSKDENLRSVASNKPH